MADLPTPDLLAHGLTNYSIDVAGDLWAGEMPIFTDQGVAAVNIEQFRVIAYNEAGQLVPYDPGADGVSNGNIQATGTLTFSGVGTAADTITINGQVITLVAASPTGAQVLIGASATATAQNLKTYINANYATLGVTASGAAAVLTLTAVQPGTVGNAITTVESGTSTAFGAATLTGGANEVVEGGGRAARAIGVAAVAIPASVSGPFYTGGCFNHQKLIWPAGVTTLAQRKLALSGRTISVRQLL